MRAMLVVAIPFVLMAQGCVPRQAMIEAIAPVEKVRRMSIEDVNIIANQTSEFLSKNGTEKTLHESIEAAKRSLKDPESAKFRNVEIREFGFSKVVCGEVNGKNSYGGYAGFSKFVASPYSATLYDNSSSRYKNIDAASNAGINLACR